MNNEEILQPYLDKYLQDPTNPDLNYWLGYEYEKIGQYASAHSYYLRCAELTDDKDLQYECLLKTWTTIAAQGRRPWYERQQLLLALTHSPKRPEAYYFLSLIHSYKEEWKESLMYASVGLENCIFDKTTRTDVGYKGKGGLLLQKAYTIWYTGQRQEAYNLWIETYNYPDIAPEHKTTARNNLLNWGYLKFKNEPQIYTKDLHSKLKVPFLNSENIETTYSQCMQDLFVLTMLKGKINGYYIELGSGDPFIGSNTALLESLGWDGLSIDWNGPAINKFKSERKNLILAKNTLETDFLQLFSQFQIPKEIDYLSLDVDPSDSTYKTLLRLPLDQYKFAVITYEHDYWYDETISYKDKSREYLQKYGYKLVVSDMGANEHQSFEDWWIHPDLVDFSIVEKIQNTSPNIKLAKNILLN